MRTPSKASISALLSLIVGLAVTLAMLGYGVTEELPIGSLNGLVTMKENGQPLPNAFVQITKVAQGSFFDYEDYSAERRFKTDKDGRFHLRNLVAGHYKIEVSTKAHEIKKEFVEIAEGRPTVALLAAAPRDPYLDLYASQRVSMPSETPVIQLKGSSNSVDLKVSVVKLDFDKVIAEGGMYHALAPLARRDQGKLIDPRTMGKELKKFDHTIRSRDAEGTFTEKVEVPDLKEGLYWVECDLAGLSRGTWLSVTKMALVVKHVGAHVAAYVTAIDTGVPIAGASVGYGTPSGVSETGKTSSDGLVSFTLPKKSENKADVIVASSGESKAIVDFNRPAESDEDTAMSQMNCYTYTDRPIYRPGDLVQYKGIVRQLVGSDYVLPQKPEVVASIQDDEGTQMQSVTLKLGPMGTFSGSYRFSKDALPAEYSLVTKYGDKVIDTKSIGVAAYRKPTFSIKVEPEKATYIRGEIAKMDVKAEYYYGAPVVGAEVKATVSREPHWDWQDFGYDSQSDFQEDEYSEYAPDDVYEAQSLHSYRGEQTQEYTVKTDANGKAVIAFPTRGVNERREAESDFDYTVSVDIKDQSDKIFSASGTVPVLKSDYKLNVDVDSYVATAGQPFNVKAAVKDANGRPLPNYPVTLESGFVEWDKRREILVERQVRKVATGSDGALQQSIDPPGAGFYQVRAQIVDERGNAVTKTAEVYLEGAASRFDQPSPSTKLAVKLDKKAYHAGDTVKALITCNDPGGTALLAIEGADIYDVRPVKLGAKTTVFRFTVKDSFAPDVYVSVSYVKSKRYADATKRLMVDLGRRKLTVEVKPDKPIYHPGDTAVYTVQTKTAAGAPTSAEVSLGVVDESIYAIFDDHSDIVKAFYPKRANNVNTEFSFPELYLGGGDKAPTNIQVRRKFEDTAFWQPAVSTNAQGEAKVAVKLPDNLTSWRATVRAVTAQTEVGQSTVNVIAQKDLMVQLSAPTYVVNGDQQRLVAMITNHTGAAATVKLALTPDGVKVDGDLNTDLQIDEGAMKTVEYKMTPDHSGEVSITAKAWIPGGASDGMELKVPVTPHARLVTDGRAGSTNSTQSVTLNLKNGFDPDSGGLRISVAPSIATSLLGSLDELIGFPYGCVEQTTSKFLPAVVFSKSLADIGLPKPKLADKIPQIVADSYARLEGMQHGDGGWGWWENDDSDPYMTAYVLEAIYRAQKAGYEPPAGIHTDKALDWAVSLINTPSKWKVAKFQRYALGPDEDLMYLSYAVCLHGRQADVKGFLLGRDTSKLNSAQSAYCALAADLLGSEGAGKRDQALSRMLLLAKATPSTVEWPDDGWFGFETTGRCFMALLTLKPNHPYIPKIVTLLMQKRRGDMWFSTRDTSAILLVMADYLRHTKELLSDADIEVKLNGVQISQVHLVKTATFGPDTDITVPISKLKEGDNALEFAVQKGYCYYTVQFKQYVTAPDLGPVIESKGLSIQRSYFKLESQRMEDGTLRLMPSKAPITTFKSGDIIRCQIKVHTDAGRDYVQFEDPTPSGCRVTDREDPGENEKWTLWWSRTVILDDRVSFFARDVPAGDSILEYTMRAENPGTCHALPTTAFNMYDAADSAGSAEAVIQVDQ